MKKLFSIAFLSLVFCVSGYAQDICPSGQVCLPQATANRLLESVNALIEAKTVIAKLTSERGASDAVIASANRVIADYKTLDDINTLQIAKYKDIVALYEKTLALYVSLVDKMQAKIDAPKSGFKKFMDALKTIGYILAGAALGRGIIPK